MLVGGLAAAASCSNTSTITQGAQHIATPTAQRSVVASSALPDTVESTVPDEMTTDQMIAWYESRSDDCNGNGLVDSIDIARGYVEDANHNGVIDNCGTDTITVSQVIRNGAWRRTAYARDSSFLSVVYSIDQTVTILYTVPSGGAHVRLRLTGAATDADTILVDRFQKMGAYQRVWTRGNAPRREPRERTFVLTVGRRQYVRRMAWR